LEDDVARKTMNRRRHRSELRGRRSRRIEKSRRADVLGSLATMIREAERRRRISRAPGEQPFLSDTAQG
jgi:hypothetical protein